jgi:AcrR family transcriptional regulator
MSTAATDLATISRRPRRADAQRNYDKLLQAARAAFTEADTETSLEDIARRAGVGIGTLYRHFPTRQILIEAVYVGEVEALSRSARDVADRPPWEALTIWLRRFVDYVATKQALANELFAAGASSDVFASCRAALYEAGTPLLERAQQAGAVRPDVNIGEVLHLVSGIAKMTSLQAAEIERILDIALDGLRHRTADAP